MDFEMGFENMRSKKFLTFACLVLAGLCGCSDNSSSSSPAMGDSLTDSRDNQTYRTVVIGEQTWMAQNLNYAAEGSYCYNESGDCSSYGRLYTYNAASACPDGWHLPSLDEFNALLSNVGAGEELKAADGFSALFAGFRKADGTFAGAGESALFWSATEKAAGSDEAYSLILSSNTTTAALLPT